MHLLIVVVAAAVVAVLHSVLPDHWVPIAVVARANRWSLQRTAKTSLWAAGGHVLGSLAIGAVLIALGTGVKSLIAVQGRIVGVVLVVTGVVLLAWALWQRRSGHGHKHGHGHGHSHPHHQAVQAAHTEEPGHPHDHPHPHEHAGEAEHDSPHGHDQGHTHPHEPGHPHDHPHPHEPAGEGEHAHAPGHDHGHPHDHPHPHEDAHPDEPDHSHSHDHDHPHPHDPAHDPASPMTVGAPAASKGWAASLAVPFGVAASPDLTILPVFLAASAISLTASIAVVLVFSVATLATFVGLTVAATAGGYKVEWPWLEENAEVVSSAVLILLGVVAYLAL